jgi:protein-arginine kinase activator protein McsA
MCDGCAITYIQLSQIGQEPMLFSPQTAPQPPNNKVLEQSDDEPKNAPVKKVKKNPKYIETVDELFDLFMMRPKKKEIACPKCGMTPTDFQKKGKMGCPECYNFYKDEVPDVLAVCQEGGIKHVGKRPKIPVGNPVELLKTLKLKLAHAIEQENYEEASDIKKQITAVQDKLQKENLETKIEKKPDQRKS